MFQKKKGDASTVGGMIATCFTLFVVFTAVYAYAAWQAQLEQSYEIDLVMHKYLVEMETIDFSSQTAINQTYNSLKTELQQHGVSGISFSGSTQAPVEPGEKISLHVTGTVHVSYVDMPAGAGLAGASMAGTNMTIDITKNGTAMY